MAYPTQWSSLLTKLKSFQPPTIEDLQKYSTANLDTWTVQLGQALCDRFQFAPLGHRNLANALHSLPGNQFRPSDFETGYGYHHVLHVFLRSSEGSTLAAVTGVLAEYFNEDFVVDFFKILATRAKVPQALQPLESQWRRMVQVLYGVLATSSFGQVVSNDTDVPVDLRTDIDMLNLIIAMESMSAVAQKTEKSIVISCGSDIVFQTAIASWLFDLSYNIVTSVDTVRASGNLKVQNEPSVIFELSRTDAAPTSTETGISPRYHYPMDIYVVGGRVPFESLLKLTFGSLFTDIKPDTLATYVACAARLMHDHLDTIGRGSEFSFLPHNSGSSTGPGFGFIDTMMGWFTELRRLSARFDRLSKLSLDESKMKFRQSSETLREMCACSICHATSSVQPDFCTVTVVESVVTLGLYVTRMVVHPGLYPKVKGIRKLAEQIQGVRTAGLNGIDYLEDFMKRIGQLLPDSQQMLRMGAHLFSNAASKEIDSQIDLMGITHAGLAIFLNGGAFNKNPANVKVADRDKNPVTIWISNGSMCVFGHEINMEIYTPRATGLTFSQMWEQFRLQNDVRQLLKLQGSSLLSSLVPIDEKEEAQAEAQGWIVIRS